MLPPPSSTLFPTRRSSDLAIRPGLQRRVEMGCEVRGGFDQETRDRVVDFGGFDRRQTERSEEHTSELQSHSDLVCRLLLEKKKKNVETQTDALAVDSQLVL